MPRFNARGDWAAGLGGGEPGPTAAKLIINGVAVDPGPGGAGDWLNEDEIVTRRWTSYEDFRAVAISRTGAQRTLRMGRCEGVWGGGDRWATVTHDGTYLLEDGTVVPYPIIGFTPDGALLTQGHQWNGTGLIVYAHGTGLETKGRRLSNDVVWDVHALDAQRMVWREKDGPYAIGMPVPALLPGESYQLRVAFDGSRWWVLYLAAGWNGRLVLHPFDSFEGYALTAPGAPCDRADLVAIDGVLYVIWATVVSEQLGQIAGPFLPQVDARFNLTDLRDGDPGTPAPAPVPDPPRPEPVPPPAPVPHPDPPAPPKPAPRYPIVTTYEAHMTEQGWLIGPGDRVASVHADGRVTFDRTELRDDDLLELTKPDDRYGFRHLASGLWLGADATKETPTGNVCQQLYAIPERRGNYEFWSVGQWEGSPIVSALVFYDRQGADNGRPWTSAALTWVKK